MYDMDENFKKEDNLKRIEVKIAGMDYVLKTDEDEEYILRIANYINKRMSEVISTEPQLSTSLSAMLTAFLITDEYFKHLKDCEKVSANGAEAEAYLKEIEEYKKRLEEANNIILLQTQQIEKLEKTIESLSKELDRTKKELDDFINAFDGDR